MIGFKRIFKRTVKMPSGTVVTLESYKKDLARFDMEDFGKK